MQEIIDDKYILNHCFRKDGMFNGNCVKNNDSLCLYLKSRYDDIPEELFTYAEVAFRIKYNIDIRPVCPICGGPVKFINKNGMLYQTFCSRQCVHINNKKVMSEIWNGRSNIERQEIANKSIQTCMLKYNVPYSFQSDNNKEKSRLTCNIKYGKDSYGRIGSTEYKENISKIYNSDFPQSTHAVRNRISETMSSDVTQQKMIQTCQARYNVSHISQLSEIQEKINETYRKNNTFNSSSDEKILFDILSMIFPTSNIHTNYYNKELYPFRCDFYIDLPDFSLYIEFNGSMYHNYHLYQQERDTDELCAIQKRSDKLSHHPNRYDSLINTWTTRDIIKWEKAVSSNINMLFIYPGFYKDWIYFKRHTDDADMQNDIKNILQTFIYNNYKDKKNIQLIIGEIFK